jgi:hypothetical protein
MGNEYSPPSCFLSTTFFTKLDDTLARPGRRISGTDTFLPFEGLANGSSRRIGKVRL